MLPLLLAGALATLMTAAPVPSAVAAPRRIAAPLPAAVAAPRHAITPAGPVGLADSIVIEKQAHRLTLYHMGRPMRRYLIALGRQPKGDKLSRGDKRTPEGVFSIESRNENSEYHLSLRISYPDERHRARAESLGLDPGGDIFIHGLPNGRGLAGASHRVVDWTNGCIALTDEEIEELWNAVPIGTPVEIKP